MRKFIRVTVLGQRRCRQLGYGGYQRSLCGIRFYILIRSIVLGCVMGRRCSLSWWPGLYRRGALYDVVFVVECGLNRYVARYGRGSRVC